MATSSSQRKPLLPIVAIVALLAGNAVQYALYSGVKLERDLAQQESTFYKDRYKENLGKDTQLTRDFTDLYVGTIKDLQAAAAKGDRKAAMTALDSANFLSGFLSRYTRDGSRLSSADFAAALQAGKLGAAEQKQLADILQHIPNRSEQAVQRLLEQIEARPEDPQPVEAKPATTIPTGSDAPATAP